MGLSLSCLPPRRNHAAQCEQFLGMARLFNYRMLSISYKSIGSSRLARLPPNSLLALPLLLVLAARPTAAKLNEVKNVNFIWAPNVGESLVQQRRLKTKQTRSRNDL